APSLAADRAIPGSPLRDSAPPRGADPCLAGTVVAVAVVGGEHVPDRATADHNQLPQASARRRGRGAAAFSYRGAGPRLGSARGSAPGTGVILEILLLTSAAPTELAGPDRVLAALDLLPHTVRAAPLDVGPLMAGGSPDVVLVDARTDLIEAR